MLIFIFSNLKLLLKKKILLPIQLLYIESLSNTLSLKITLICLIIYIYIKIPFHERNCYAIMSSSRYNNTKSNESYLHY